MPDVVNRPEKEKALSDLIWAQWLDWSNTDDPLAMKPEDLSSGLRSKVTDPLWGQWREGYGAVMQQFDQQQNERRAAVVFLIFFDDWVDATVDAWSDRVDQYVADQRSANPSRPPWEFTRGAGVPTAREMAADSRARFRPLPAIPSKSDPRRIPRARPLVYPSDADRISVGSITDTNTAGELWARREAEAIGDVRIEAFWNTDRDPCPECARLSGRTESFWRQYAPNGPKLHPNCRCYLTYHAFYEAVRFSTS